MTRGFSRSWLGVGVVTGGDGRGMVESDMEWKLSEIDVDARQDMESKTGRRIARQSDFGHGSFVK